MVAAGDPKALAEQAAGQAQGYALATSTALGVEAFRAETIEQARWANETARFLAAQRKAIEAQRDEIALPLHRAWKGVRELFAPAIKQLTADERKLSAEAVAFDQRQIAEQRAALQAAAAPAEIERAVALTAQVSGMGVRTDWDVEIVDPAQVPPEYWVIDVERLRALAKTEKDKFNVPGARAVARKVPVKR